MMFEVFTKILLNDVIICLLFKTAASLHSTKKNPKKPPKPNHFYTGRIQWEYAFFFCLYVLEQNPSS